MKSPLALTQHYELPFFDDTHQGIAASLVSWTSQQMVDESDDRLACREWVNKLGEAGWLRYCVPAAHGGALPQLDSRALVILRETLAYHSPLADFAFAMQGLGSGSITLDGTPEQQAAYLPHVATGKKIAAFALSEPEAGSDVGAMQTTATPQLDGSYVLNGVKTWISNGGMADYYVVFAKTEAGLGSRGISAFVVDSDATGLDASEHIHVMAPHPLATLRFNNCRVPAGALLGGENLGFKLAMRTLDIFRASVAAAALGMARRAMDEALAYAKARAMFGGVLADMQLTQARFGEMAALIDSAALLTYRAAWLRDVQGTKDATSAAAYSRASAMAKMVATENASQVIDKALQLFGGRGVQVGSVIEHLYRDIRSLRIYEGATEVQQLIIGKSVLKEA
jgi:acyl-CoA dehydrogenase